MVLGIEFCRLLARWRYPDRGCDPEERSPGQSRTFRIDQGMTSYAEMARERQKARSLYLELRALGLELYAKEDPHDATGYRARVAGLHSLPKPHADRIRRRVEARKPGLLRILFGRWDPDIVAIQREGAAR